MACSALPSEIAQNDLTHCYYLAVHCRTHGEIRVATEEQPVDECYACPLCQALCYSTLLGEGGTLRELPFWNRMQDAHSFAGADRRLWLDRKAGRTQPDYPLR
jgi:hypothetical protein